MNLSWAEKLAKNALLTAQKRIDSVLDIKPDEPEEDQVSIKSEEEEKVDEEQDADTAVTARSHFQSDVEEEPSDYQEVVDAEPNPIRDAHDEPGTSIMHYSPSSTSPDEDENHQRHDQGNHIDLSAVQEHVHDHQRDDQHYDHKDDGVTVASSDIVVIRNVDDWSLASGSHRRTGSDQASIVMAAVQPKQDDREHISMLEAKIRHRDQRMEELSHQNEKLKIQNANLQQKVKSLNNKVAGETKLLKQLTEKDEQVAELMEEGKNLSAQNGKLSKELKRLKDIEKDFEAQRVHLQEAMDEIDERTDKESSLQNDVQSLKAKLVEQEHEFSALKEKLNTRQEQYDDLQLAEQRCQSQRIQIQQLEERVDQLMTAQREAAEQIALSNAPLLATIEELEARVKESDCAKFILQKKLRFAEEKAENFQKQATHDSELVRQQLATLKLQNDGLQNRIRSLEESHDTLSKELDKARDMSRAVENEFLEEISELKQSVSKKEDEVHELRHELHLSNQKTRVVEKVEQVSEPRDTGLLENVRELERENSHIRLKLQELQHAHDTLLLIHGEGAVRVEELKQENEDIKRLCKEQTLLLASMGPLPS